MSIYIVYINVDSKMKTNVDSKMNINVDSKMSLNTNVKLAPPPQADIKQENSEIIYSLPKTYNGKTVFDLFPEFEQDSVNIAFRMLFSYLQTWG